MIQLGSSVPFQVTVRGRRFLDGTPLAGSLRDLNADGSPCSHLVNINIRTKTIDDII